MSEPERAGLEKEVLDIADYLGCNGPELWSEVSKLFEATCMEVIGEDSKEIRIGLADVPYVQNRLRAQQRQALSKLLGRGDV